MEENKGDAVYYWALLDMDLNANKFDFWSSCDSLNAGHCRYLYLNKLMFYYHLYLIKQFNAKQLVL